MTTAIGYVRVSTEEQASSGAGLQAQRAAILAEATRRGWHLVEVMEDAGFGGSSLHRPGIAAALEALRSGKADTLVVAKLDRLSRSMLDFAAIMDRSTREGWTLVALDLGVDTTTPSGEMVANVMATFAQFERRLIGQRTKEALAARKAAGVRLGRRSTIPPGVTQLIAARRAEGATLQRIADELTDGGVATGQGGRRWYASTVRAVLGGGRTP